MYFQWKVTKYQLLFAYFIINTNDITCSATEFVIVIVFPYIIIRVFYL